MVKDLIHLFFPHVCTGCGSDVIDSSNMLCLRCLSELPVTNFFEQPSNPVEEKFYGRMAVRHAGAAYYFTKDSLLENLVYQLKYRGNKNIGVYLGKLMGELLQESKQFQSVDAIIPLPLNKRREKKRGYNQATALANGMCSVWNKPLFDKAVLRNVHTETQTKKDRLSRWENMQGVFAIAQPEALQGKHLLLIDDVVTTGASLETCGIEILKVNSTTLSIATLACTMQ